MNRPRSADDFATIRARMQELRREREGSSPATRTRSRTRRGRVVMRSADRDQLARAGPPVWISAQLKQFPFDWSRKF
jgi:hypothetical protein